MYAYVPHVRPATRNQRVLLWIHERTWRPKMGVGVPSGRTWRTWAYMLGGREGDIVMNYDTLSFLAGLFSEPADTPMAMLDGGGTYERDERAAIVWCENGPAHEVDDALRAAFDGFEQSCRSDRFEPVAVDADGGTGQNLAVAAAPRPRPTVPVTVEWPGAAADFCLLLTADDLPEVPFRLNGWTQVMDAAKMLRSLRADILRGPSGSRAFYGALQADLLALQSFALQAAKIRENGRRSPQGKNRMGCLTNSPVVDKLTLG